MIAEEINMTKDEEIIDTVQNNDILNSYIISSANQSSLIFQNKNQLLKNNSNTLFFCANINEEVADDFIISLIKDGNKKLFTSVFSLPNLKNKVIFEIPKPEDESQIPEILVNLKTLIGSKNIKEK